MTLNAIVNSQTQWSGFNWRFENEVEWLAVRDNIYGGELLAVAVTAFDILALLKDAVTASAVTKKLNLDERPVEVMLTCLAAMRVIDRSGETIQLAQSSDHVLEYYSRWLDGPFDERRPVYRSILECMRSNAPFGWAISEEPWLQKMEDASFASKFIKTMHSRGRYLGRALANRVSLKQHKRLLDVAGGSGVYSCWLTAVHTHIHATVLERPPVDKITREMIEAFDCAEQVSVSAGDMCAPQLPDGFDVHLWSNVLHDWSGRTVRELLKKSYEGLPAGGLLIIHDVLVNLEKTGPLTAAMRSVFFMVATEGMCHSLSFIAETLDEIGFERVEVVASIMDYSIVIAHKP